jgi:hypothetical protein
VRTEFATAAATPGPTDVVVRSPRRIRVDRFDLALLALFGALSLWVLALDLWQVVVNGRVWTGTDGVYIVDQLQYLSWIRDASAHVLVSNLFVLRSSPADYFQPAVVISGALSALGVAPWLSLLLWKPVAVIGSFLAMRAYVRRSLPGLWPRRAALTLAVFFGSFTVLLGTVAVLGDLFPGFLSWGYTFALLAMTAVIAALVTYDRGRAEHRIPWAPPVLGAVASLLHPWHGELLILIVVGGELVLWRGRRVSREHLTLAAVTVIATAAPLGYYAILGRVDLSWQLARVASKHEFPLWPTVLYLLPLMLPAALGYRGRSRSFLAAATRCWPLAAFALFELSATALSATPLHAFQGITLPLAILAVQGVNGIGFGRLRHRRLIAGLVIAVATIPGTIWEMKTARSLAAPTPDNANFIAADESRALDYLDHDPQPGGVLTRSYLGAVVPEKTGRQTLVGDCLWSEPQCLPRGNLATSLFNGTLAPRAARTFVAQSGARFVLSDCQATADLSQALGPMVLAVHRFGCASVYELDAPGAPRGPLTELRANAAVRAPRRQ